MKVSGSLAANILIALLQYGDRGFRSLAKSIINIDSIYVGVAKNGTINAQEKSLLYMSDKDKIKLLYTGTLLR